MYFFEQWYDFVANALMDQVTKSSWCLLKDFLSQITSGSIQHVLIQIAFPSNNDICNLSFVCEYMVIECSICRGWIELVISKSRIQLLHFNEQATDISFHRQQILHLCIYSSLLILPSAGAWPCSIVCLPNPPSSHICLI